MSGTAHWDKVDWSEIDRSVESGAKIFVQVGDEFGLSLVDVYRSFVDVEEFESALVLAGLIGMRGMRPTYGDGPERTLALCGVRVNAFWARLSEMNVAEVEAI